MIKLIKLSGDSFVRIWKLYSSGLLKKISFEKMNLEDYVYGKVIIFLWVILIILLN